MTKPQLNLRFLVLLLAALIFSKSATAQVSTIVRASVSSDESEANGGSSCPQISADGTKVTFASSATNLVSGTTYLAGGLYIRDITAGNTKRVDVNANGEAANQGVLFGGCDHHLSLSGEYVVFASESSNLVNGSGAGSQIYKVTVDNGAIALVSGSSVGQSATSTFKNPATSEDGRYITYVEQPSNSFLSNSVLVYDTSTGQTQTANVTSDEVAMTGLCGNPDISSDGRYVLFSFFSNSGLTSGLYLRDLSAGTTTLIPTGSGGSLITSFDLSPDGSAVSFVSIATDIVSGDTNNTADVFVYDVEGQTTKRVSVSSTGAQASDISYLTNAKMSMSSTGRFITFGSSAANLVEGDINGNFDVFVRDTAASKTLVASIKARCLTSDEAVNETSEGAVISSDGTSVAFLSISPRLVSNDTNSQRDVFVSKLIAPSKATTSTRLKSLNPSTCNSDAALTAPFFSLRAISTAAIKNIFYDVQVSKGSKADFRRRQSKKNAVTFRTLPSGNYSSRFRLVEKIGGQYRPITKFSPKSAFVIP